MNKMMVLQWLKCWAEVTLRSPAVQRDMLFEPADRNAGQAGLSKIATTVILVAIGVGLTLAVGTLLGDEIISLARTVAGNISGTKTDWGD